MVDTCTVRNPAAHSWPPDIRLRLVAQGRKVHGSRLLKTDGRLCSDAGLGLQDAFLEKHGVKLGFMSAFVKASADALAQVPAANGVIDGDEIVYRDYIDISIAVATPKGLVVPVLRNADELSFAGVEKVCTICLHSADAVAAPDRSQQGGTDMAHTWWPACLSACCGSWAAAGPLESGVGC